jgi:c-di-GMP-binding flagellar brake protein YcgR
LPKLSRVYGVAVEYQDLGLSVGEKVQLEKVPADRAERYLVTLVGYSVGHSLILSTPRNAQGNVLIIRHGMRFNVRMLHHGDVQGFLGTVLEVYNHPFPHMHINYPREIESIAVRNAMRVRARIPCAVRNSRLPDEKKNYRIGTIIDLSNSGCKLESQSVAAKADEVLMMQFNIEVNKQEERVAVMGLVRAVSEKEKDGKTLVFSGIQFTSINRYQQVLLHAFVLEAAIR